ncbi:hypothetical protein QWY31_11940 [Cytophagales bacterium LB-30]|uniref:Uncharacterized protein n=1 Tax=Shiella aurantiaca TaxID=3058365 RepID=A0ABT8F711_9BACT|nr:hypothetical protein [Shiella aurantiaca]MDN4166217.1 hypothetical protein [Shiella aurantiaca]
MSKIVFLFSIVVLSISTSFSQELDIESTLRSYSSELKPYVKEIVDREYGLNEEQDFTIEQVKSARQAKLMIDTLVIKKYILDLALTRKEQMKDSVFVRAMIENQYRTHYQGLPPAFYEGARKKLKGK